MPDRAGIQPCRLSGLAVAVKGSLRRASPALDRAHETPPPTRFSKEALFKNILFELDIDKERPQRSAAIPRAGGVLYFRWLVFD